MRDYQNPSDLARAHLQALQRDEERTSANSVSPPRSRREATPAAAPKPSAFTAFLRHGNSGVADSSVVRSSLLQLQRIQGNQYVQRVLQLAGEAGSETDVAPEVEQTIERTRGGGQPLDRSTAQQMGEALGADFNGVRVHTNSDADALNRTLSAQAFTTGQDVYFREGAYSPGSSAGRELLAHELTHVVQQNGDQVEAKPEEEGTATTCRSCAQHRLAKAVQTKLSLGRPGDIYEQEADRMAQAYTNWERASVSGDSASRARRQSEPAEEEKPIQGKPDATSISRQIEENPEEEDMAQTQLEDKSVQCQGE